MKVSELRKQNKIELEKMLTDLRKKLSSIGFDFAIKKVKNTNEAKNIKKDIARILTILKEK